MRALSIAIKDLQIYFKARGSVLYLFLLPILFIMMFAALGGAASSASDALLPLPVVNNDPGGEAAEQFLASLRESDKVETIMLEQAAAEEQLSQMDIEWLLIIPANFSTDLAANRETTFLSNEEENEDSASEADPIVAVRLLVHPNHTALDLKTVERVISRATRDIALTDYLNDSLTQLREMQADNPQAETAFMVERINQQVDTQEEAAQQRPLVIIKETTPAASNQADTEVEIPNVGQTAVVGFAVLFVFLASQTTAQSIFDEKRVGSFRRLLAAPISKTGLLSGKLLPNLILTLVQIVVIFFVGFYLLPLVGVPSLDLSSDPLGLIVTSLAIALCSTSLGILIAALAHTESQVGGISAGLLWVAGLLGGSLVPVFLFPEMLAKVARFVPHYWANQAYFGLIFRGETLQDVGIDVLVLLGFTLLFFLVGVWRFDFD